MKIAIVAIVLWNMTLMPALHITQEKGQIALGIDLFSDIGKRQYQEDRYSNNLVDGGYLFCIFDGHNGSEVSTDLKNSFHIYFMEASGSVEEKFKTAFNRADNSVCVKKNSNCGSTVTAVFIKNNIAHFAHAGDSRAVLEKSGTLDFATLDHKPNRLDEQARIEKLGGNVMFFKKAYRVEGNLAVSRAIGDWYMKKYIISDPEYTEKKLTADNRFIVLGSDGLWDEMSNEDVIKKLTEEIKSTQAMGALACALGTYAQKKRCSDNITILVVDLLRLGSSGT